MRSCTYISQNFSAGDFHRGDCKGSRFIQQQIAHEGASMSDGENEDSVADLKSQVIYGTSINSTEILGQFENFLKTFRIGTDESNSEIYIQNLQHLQHTGSFVLDLNCEHLYQYSQVLYFQLINFPLEMIPIFDLCATNVYVEKCSPFIPSATGSDPVIQVRTFNLRKHSRMRDLGVKDIDRLVSVKGIIIRVSEVIPEMREAHFKCSICDMEVTTQVERGKISEPKECTNCNGKFTFELVHNNCLFSDKQHIKMQETPDSIPEGETPQTLHICCYDDLVDSIRPGDRVEVCGIYRTEGVRDHPFRRTLSNIFRTYIDAISFNTPNKDKFTFEEYSIPEGSVDSSNVNVSSEEIQLTETMIDNIKKFSKDKNLYDRLVEAVAPSIWECDDVKKGLLLQLFGGMSKNFSHSGRGRFRGEVNILLVGDPSTAKSQLLQYIHKVSSRGVYTSGKGSSAVGLTAYVTRDKETKEILLESGALVLSDRGICCIDEFDKMDDSTRSVLHEAMEQQTISVAKAGIICQLNARAAILAAANPVQSRYNVRLPIIANIRLPPSLLSRFDLIYLLLDKYNPGVDRQLSEHILSLYGEGVNLTFQEPTISKEFLASYVSYARRFVHPVLGESVGSFLIQEYVAMRDRSSDRHTISATPRQLEALIRLSEAHARMRLAKTVKMEDVYEASRLVKVALRQAATDPKTGLIDVELLTNGVSALSKEKLRLVKEQITKILIADKSDTKSEMLYYKLFEIVKKNLHDPFNPEDDVSDIDYKLALRVLEEENKVDVLGSKTTLVVRVHRQGE